MAELQDISQAKRDLIVHMNGFELNQLVGRGGFADVYKATNVETKEVVALKYFRKGMKTFSSFYFAASEIAFMRILQHPNIVQMKVFEINLRYVFIGTEYAAFGSLIQFLTPKKPLAEEFVQVVMRQVLSALDYMHSLGIMHGDVKPDNILCMDINMNRPSVKLCDFGLSEIILKGENFRYNSGSALFMAPEVHLKLLVDVTSDLWSMGVVMYKMMFSQSLFGFEEKDVKKYVHQLKLKAPLDFPGCERYSVHCNNLLKRLLRYSKRFRIQGEALRKHPFLRLKPAASNGTEFLDKARYHITRAETFSNNKIFGRGLVEGVQAVIELKMHHNSLEEKEQQVELRPVLKGYHKFVMRMERHLFESPDTEGDLSDEDFKKLLSSKPNLLAGFEIGCSAEVFRLDENYPMALKLFHQAVESMVPFIKTEPKSYLKKMLGFKLSKWIEEIDDLNKMLFPEEMSSSSATTVSTS